MPLVAEYDFQRDRNSGANDTYQAATMSGATMRLAATKVRGRRVINYDNEDLGTVEDLMLDVATGRLGYAVLACIGAAQEKLFPVPVRALTIDTDGSRFMLNADRETLKYAPGFDRNDWPDTGDPGWKSGVESFYSF